MTPFGKYRYNVLPMGLKCSTDFAQETMENIFRDIKEADDAINDLGYIPTFIKYRRFLHGFIAILWLLPRVHCHLVAIAMGSLPFLDHKCHGFIAVYWLNFHGFIAIS